MSAYPPLLASYPMSNSANDEPMLDITESTSGFSDDLLEEKIFREISWTYEGVDLELFGVLDLHWTRVTPEKDLLPFDFEYSDQTSPHILMTARCLVRSDGDLVIMTDAFLYVEASLATAGEGPQATPDYFKDLSCEELDLSKALDNEIREMLLDLASDDHTDKIVKLISSHEDHDKFIATIMDDSVRQAFKQRRE
jgi:hypothetical protein